MSFNFTLLFAALRRTFSGTQGTDARLTLKRLLVIAVVFPTYAVLEGANWLGFLLDELLFPGYQRQPVNEPVFIVGVQRSGTTFLHRLMERDTELFTSMKMWEILFAPSVVQKKILRLLGALDDALGSPVTKLILKLERPLFQGMTAFHRYSLFAAEEDEFLLVHRFSSLFLITMFPFAELLKPYVYFDTKLCDRERQACMHFYRRCVQKHLYAFGPDKHFLSKNPFFSGTIQSLNTTFPDAKFICTVRTPYEGLPSALSMWSTCLTFLLSPHSELPLLEEQKEIVAHYYRYPLGQLDALGPERKRIVMYNDLVQQPVQLMENTYRDFGFTLSPAYAQTLEREQEKARRYESTHEYALERFGLSREGLRRQYADIFERFGFEG